VVGVDLDADRRVRLTVKHQHRGGAADPVLGEAGLAQQPAFDEVGDKAGDGRLVEAGGRGDVRP
jgi:hypothetical protein